MFWLRAGSANPYLTFEVCRLSAKYSGVLSLNPVYLSRLYRRTKDGDTDAEFFMGIFFASEMDTKGRFTGLVDHLFVAPLPSLGGICFSSASMMVLKKNENDVLHLANSGNIYAAYWIASAKRALEKTSHSSFWQHFLRLLWTRGLNLSFFAPEFFCGGDGYAP